MSELRLWLLRLSMTRWMVLAKGYGLTTCPTLPANSAPERSGVAVVKCRPVFGSTTPNTFAVPHRSYSLSCLAGFPGLAWDRRAHIGVQRYRLFVQANDRLGGIVRLFIDGQHILHLPDVLFIQFRDAPHFFPPRLQVVALQQNPDCL